MDNKILDIVEAIGQLSEYKVDLHIKQMAARKTGNLMEYDKLEAIYRKTEKAQGELFKKLDKLNGRS